MKTLRKTIFIFVLGLTTASLTGCFGEFALTRKVYEWNDNVSDSRFVKTLVFWGLNIIPVYEVVALGDLIIFNLIEFWTGSNPLAMAEGEHEYQVVEYAGQSYELHATAGVFEISIINESGTEQLISLAIENNQVIANQEFVVAEVVR